MFLYISLFPYAHIGYFTNLNALNEAEEYVVLNKQTIEEEQENDAINKEVTALIRWHRSDQAFSAFCNDAKNIISTPKILVKFLEKKVSTIDPAKHNPECPLITQTPLYTLLIKANQHSKQKPNYFEQAIFLAATRSPPSLFLTTDHHGRSLAGYLSDSMRIPIFIEWLHKDLLAPKSLQEAQEDTIVMQKFSEFIKKFKTAAGEQLKTYILPPLINIIYTYIES